MANKTMHHLVIEDNNYEIFDQKARQMVASEYDASKTYHIGDLVVYDGKLLRCTAEITTPEAYNLNHWTYFTVKDALDNLEQGNVITSCDTAENDLNKTAMIFNYDRPNYAPKWFGIVAIRFVNAVKANSTLNINNTGARAIYKGTAPITDGVIKAGDTALFMLNGVGRYVFLGSDTYGDKIDSLTADVTTLKEDIITIVDDDTTTAYLRMVFQRGRLDASDGQIKAAAYRVSTTDIQQFDYDIVFSVSSDYRMFFCLYNADGSYITSTGFITDDYTIKAGQKFRATVALRTGESSSVRADIPTFASNLFMTTKTYDKIEDIKTDLYSPLKCGLLESKGTTINIADCTVTGTNVEVIDSCKSRFAKKSKLIRIKKLEGVSSYEVNIQLPKAIPTDRFFLTFRMSDISKDTSVGSYFNVRYNSTTNNLTHNNGLSTIQNWNNLIVHFSTSQNVTNVKLIFGIRNSVAVGDYCGEYWLDSLTFNSVMKPTFILNFDQWWQESIDNGGYQYCFDNNIPFTLMTKNYDSLGSTFINLAKQAERIYGCENSYYASYGSSNLSLLNASTYNKAVNEVEAMKNDFINAFGHDFVSFGCTQMKLNSIDRTALRNANIKMIRGDGAQLIPYYDDEEYWTPCIGISSDTLTLAQVKAQIDFAVQFGYCMLAFTHGICADDSNMMSGSNSNGMHITDFKSMIDYLVSLRSQGKIQICTMEDWYNQCVH